MIDFFLSIITHPAFNVVSGLAGFYFGNKFIIGRDKITRFNNAADDFHAAFVEELTALDRSGPTIEIKDPFETLDRAAAKHKEAIRKFSRFLTKAEVTALDSAWKSYYRHHKHQDKDHVCLEQYSTAGHSREEREKRRTLAYEKLSEIVKFSAHK